MATGSPVNQPENEAPHPGHRTMGPVHNTDGVFEDLKAAQREFGYLPTAQIELIAHKHNLHIKDVHAVASFYPHFHMTPPARVDVRVCTDMTCHLRGANDLKTVLLQKAANTKPEELSVRDVSCLGRCDLAPGFSINDRIYCNMTESNIVNMVEAALLGKALPEPEVIKVSPQLQTDPYLGQGREARYGVLKQALEKRDWPGVTATLKAAALRGMGGAGFPTGVKWEAVKGAPGDEKYIVCNADESEPGTIKDRYIMENLPHLLVEGMILAGLVTGARTGIVYIRHEYENPQEIIEEEIQHCYKYGILGDNVMGSGLQFDLRVFVSPGGYVCGEETALIEAIEGKRSEPRNKPPFPVYSGLWNKPTVINNVESFVLAIAILGHGVDWWKNYGRNGVAGIKFVGISGDVVNPGIFEVPMGISYEELIMGHAGGAPGGRKIVGFAPSGPSSGYLPAEMMKLPLDWNEMAKVGSMVGSGAIVVCAEPTCMLDMALNSVKFYRNESCGKCVPCRVGSQKMVDIITGWTEGRYQPSDMQLVEELSDAMRLTSICGLGQIVPAPIQSVIQHFRAEVDEHILHQRCPADICFKGKPVGATQ